MFVLPALFALACDSLVIYIGRRPLAEEEERGIGTCLVGMDGVLIFHAELLEVLISRI
jgi:hypothetical protein